MKEVKLPKGYYAYLREMRRGYLMELYQYTYGWEHARRMIQLAREEFDYDRSPEGTISAIQMAILRERSHYKRAEPMKWFSNQSRWIGYTVLPSVLILLVNVVMLQRDTPFRRLGMQILAVDNVLMLVVGFLLYRSTLVPGVKWAAMLGLLMCELVFATILAWPLW